jgi:hypothetical protein
MGPEGSLTCSEEPSTGPYPEPDHSSPHYTILSLLRSIVILSIHLRLGLPTGLFISAFSTKTLYALLFCSFLAKCPAHLTLLGLIIRIILGEEYKLMAAP